MEDNQGFVFFYYAMLRMMGMLRLRLNGGGGEVAVEKYEVSAKYEGP